ncbi:MAG: hypothetical protein PUD10_07290 [Lachnospira sp.]|nr:hypothetical protein [Lachnospira sp.]
MEKERESNSVRKKDISSLEYINIPDTLPYLNTPRESLNDSNPEIAKYINKINSLKDSKILNLTGISNTDLKMQYGPANLATLSEYDDNYTELVRTIAELTHKLIEINEPDNARPWLEYSISINTDIKSCYTDLADIYILAGRPEKVRDLISKARHLNSINKPVIIDNLTSKLR